MWKWPVKVWRQYRKGDVVVLRCVKGDSCVMARGGMGAWGGGEAGCWHVALSYPATGPPHTPKNSHTHMAGTGVALEPLNHTHTQIHTHVYDVHIYAMQKQPH